MKTKLIKKLCAIFLAREKKKNFAIILLLPILFIACDEWTLPKPIETEIKTSAEQNPELWIHYMNILKNYKQSDHFIVYGKFVNGNEKPTHGGHLIRSLPDSLDIVSLVNADKMSDADREDMALLQEKSTKILYCVNYAAKRNELSDKSKLSDYLDKALADAAQLQLDGFSFTGIPLYGGNDAERTMSREAAKLIVEKLGAVAGEGKDKLLVFEGDPAFVSPDDIAKLSFVALNTDQVDNISDLKLRVSLALTSKGLTNKKLLLTTDTEGTIINEDNIKKNMFSEIVEYVASLGPLGGLAINDIGKDYYHSTQSYNRIRNAIQLMNP